MNSRIRKILSSESHSKKISRAVYSGITLFLAVTIFLSSCSGNGAESISSVSHTEEPVPVTQTLDPTPSPTATQERIAPATAAVNDPPRFLPEGVPTATEVVINTQVKEERTPRPTKTPRPTRTGFPVIPWTRDWHEEWSHYGYYIVLGPFWSEEMSPYKNVLMCGHDAWPFRYEGYVKEGKDLFIQGYVEYMGEEHHIKVGIDSLSSKYRLSGGLTFAIGSSDEIEQRLKVEKTYPNIQFYIFDRQDGKPIEESEARAFTEEEWREIRSEIDAMLRNGGSTEKFKLVVNIISGN